MDRRTFLGKSLIGAAGLLLGPWLDPAVGAGSGLGSASEAAATARGASLPMRTLGATGEQVSLLGLGAAPLGRDTFTDEQAVGLVRAALDEGVTLVEVSREEQGGRSEARLGQALRDGYRDKAFLVAQNCGHARDGESARRSLEESLKALQTDRLDLWLFHEVIYDNDPAWIFTRGGMEAAIQARKEGKVRFIGFSGHKLPEILLDLLARPFPWDVVMMPLNMLDVQYRSFEKSVLPEAVKRRIGVVGLKPFGSSPADLMQQTKVSVADGLRYAMSLPVSSVVVDLDSLDQVRKLAAATRAFVPLSPGERALLLARTAPVAGDGRFETYKSTEALDGDAGKAAHGFSR